MDAVRMVLVAWLSASVACSPFGGGAFRCELDTQCAGGPGPGRCELTTGFCSFADGTCDSGQRYGESSGALAGLCVGDEPPDPIDAPQPCFGAGLVRVCLPSAPSTHVQLDGSTPINTDVDASCTQIAAQAGGPSVCVIAGTTLDVTGMVIATGSRPLVLFASGAITVAASGTVDVSSSANRVGAGANYGAVCDQPAFRAGTGEGDSGGAGGGAGGGFGSPGATGAVGDSNDNQPPSPHKGIPGAAGAAQPVPTVLRGGCPGGQGGGGAAVITALGAAGGASGGAVYLISASSITIEGRVYASGAGGRTTPGAMGFMEGGGGGGSGGMIGIDAPMITINGIIAANGGAGAGGGDTVGGAPGAPGTTVNYQARAMRGTGASGGGGDGGDGTAVGATIPGTGIDVISGGGGGGGGIGVVWIDGVVAGNQRISPSPTSH